MVITQAQMILMVSPHRTADKRFVNPTPIIAPVVVWVVETGIPNFCVKNNVKAAAVSAQKPSTGVILVILDPIVLTIFQPPDMVPKAIAE